MHTTHHKVQVRASDPLSACLELLRQFGEMGSIAEHDTGSVRMELIEASALSAEQLIAKVMDAALVAIETQGLLPSLVEDGNLMRQTEEMRFWTWMGFPESVAAQVGSVELQRLAVQKNEDVVNVDAVVAVTWMNDT